MTTITKDGEYTTRSGLPVRIYAVDGSGEWPVHGAYCNNDGWISARWTADGRLIIGWDGPRSHALDLIPKPKTRKLDVWVNVYEEDDGSLYTIASHESREKAKRSSVRERNHLAIIHIEREIAEGEGLE